MMIVIVECTWYWQVLKNKYTTVLGLKTFWFWCIPSLKCSSFNISNYYLKYMYY